MKRGPQTAELNWITMIQIQMQTRARQRTTITFSFHGCSRLAQVLGNVDGVSPPTTQKAAPHRAAFLLEAFDAGSGTVLSAHVPVIIEMLLTVKIHA